LIQLFLIFRTESNTKVTTNILKLKFVLKKIGMPDMKFVCLVNGNLLSLASMD
jgi:hypothetical protein